MAGHSKWANIKHRKGAQDAKRGKLFTKLIREITVSAKINGDPAANPRLRTAIDKALGQNMTRDTVDRAIKRGVGGGDGTEMERICYEGYGPNGVAMMVECLTDNRNRTVSDVRHVFTKLGGNLGTDGSVAYLFTKKGQLYFAPLAEEDKLIDCAIEAGAEDVEKEPDGTLVVQTQAETFDAVLKAMQAADLKPQEAEVTMIPATTVSLAQKDAETFLKMVELLEDLDDVQEVFANADLPDDINY